MTTFADLLMVLLGCLLARGRDYINLDLRYLPSRGKRADFTYKLSVWQGYQFSLKAEY